MTITAIRAFLQGYMGKEAALPPAEQPQPAGFNPLDPKNNPAAALRERREAQTKASATHAYQAQRAYDTSKNGTQGVAYDARFGSTVANNHDLSTRNNTDPFGGLAKGHYTALNNLQNVPSAVQSGETSEDHAKRIGQEQAAARTEASRNHWVTQAARTDLTPQQKGYIHAQRMGVDPAYAKAHMDVVRTNNAWRDAAAAYGKPVRPAPVGGGGGKNTDETPTKAPTPTPTPTPAPVPFKHTLGYELAGERTDRDRQFEERRGDAQTTQFGEDQVQRQRDFIESSSHITAADLTRQQAAINRLKNAPGYEIPEALIQATPLWAPFQRRARHTRASALAALRAQRDEQIAAMEREMQNSVQSQKLKFPLGSELTTQR